jgi:hypothetical protein
MDLKSLRVNSKKQTDGVWVEHDMETSFLIARMGNPRFKALFAKLMSPHQRKFDAGKLSQELQTQIMCRAVSETVLLGWKGLAQDGKELKYTKEKAFEILAEDTSEEFLALVIEYAQDNENYRNEEIEEEVKNLKAG